MPGNVRGASVSVTSTQLGGTATYTCNLGYGYTGGDLTRTCQSSAQWSGTEPVCVYMNSCNSFPCKNGGTCTNKPESYMCSCPDIWKGTNCEQEANVCARNPCVNYVRCEDGGTIYTCVCKPGWSGQTCNTPIDCGDPGLIVNGIVTAPETTLGNVATYSCNDGYNATIGNKERICNTDGKWSGQPLVCKYASSCSSSPCMNKASCTNLIENFECTCVLGWAGKTCNEDKQPPIASNCSNNIRVNATERSQFVYWTEPTFFDPMGSELHLVSNYETPSHTFPWGDFTIHYSATKIKNALRTECAFNITVRPTPCDLLPVPKHGTILCNDWSSDYGQFCVLACQRTFAPSLPGRLGTWVICGDDGKWSSQPSDCSLHLTNETNMLLYHPNYAEFMYERINDYPRFRDIYLNHMMKHEDISQFCKIYPGCEGSSSSFVPHVVEDALRKCLIRRRPFCPAVQGICITSRTPLSCTPPMLNGRNRRHGTTATAVLVRNASKETAQDKCFTSVCIR
ncbi:hypothetical protein DPMN_160435 [Dreissena polymorpha]|uniref:Uncharacterized protein n=1 Tax=Dreissena polymorpha TaxID=45954 RepID=A0A9D4ENG4_DREPO|nr:hypothetical protein DPMN_160435 [Dreissena polymorpha]